jgi:DNA/RNA endonuclease YhcR with UshA esterase domain
MIMPSSFAKALLVATLLTVPAWGNTTWATRSADTPIGLGDVGGEVNLTGTLVEKRAAASATAPAIWVLDYGAGRIEMPMFARTFQRLGSEVADTPVGARVAVRGSVRDFRGKVQLDPSAITPESNSASAPEAGAAGARTVEGTVTRFVRSSGEGPHVLSLQDGGAIVSVELPTEVAAAIPMETRAALVTPGARVAVIGQARAGSEGSRLVVASAADLKLKAEAATDAAPAGRDPGSVTRDQLRQELVLTGTVDAVRPSRAPNSPTRVTLRGPTGSITVVWWPELDRLFAGENAPQFGQSWTVKGLVTEHGGDLQLRAAEVLR